MDATSEYVSEYACRLASEDLSPKRCTGEADADRHHGVRRRAFDGEPASIARAPRPESGGTRRRASWARGSRRPRIWRQSRIRSSPATWTQSSTRRVPSVWRWSCNARSPRRTRVGARGDVRGGGTPDGDGGGVGPQTRATADRSLLYPVAAAFQDSGVTPATSHRREFRTRRFGRCPEADGGEELEFTRRYPVESCSRIEVTTTAGGVWRPRRGPRRRPARASGALPARWARSRGRWRRG